MRCEATKIESIFGLIETVVAEHMVREGKLTKIPQEEIPLTALYRADGVKAAFAVVVPREYTEEFEKRITNLRK